MSDITFQDDGTSLRKVSARVLIQSEAGVQQYAVLTFSYGSSSETVDIDSVRVRKPDSSSVNTPLDSIQDLPSQVTQQAPLYSDQREKHVAVKGLGVGDLLEFQAHWTTTKPLAPGQFWFNTELSGDAIVLKSTLRISVPMERAVKWRSTKFKPVVSEAGKLRTFTWTFSRLAHKSKEETDQEQATLVAAATRGRVPQPEIQVSSFTSWDELGRWYNSLQADRVKPTPDIRAKAAELTKGLTGDRAKVEAIYRYVSTQIHYIGVDFGVGRFQPHAAAEVLGNQYGDCKDKHTLLASLLDAVGIPAFPALIASAHAIDEDVPSPAQFDHVISAVQLGEQLTWLDTTPEVSPFSYLLSSLRDKEALVLVPGKPASFVVTPSDPPKKPLQSFEITAKLSDSGVLEGEIGQTLQGTDIEIVLRAAFRRVALTQWKEFMQQISQSMGFAGEVSEATAGSPEKTEEPFRFGYHYVRKDYPGWSDRLIGSPLPPFGLVPVPEKDLKPSPLFLGSPGEVHFESHVEIPKGYRPSLPAKLDLVQSYAEYHRAYSLQDGVVTTQRQLVTKLREVPVNDLNSYKKFKEQVDADVDLKVPVSSSASSPFSYQNEIWTLPYSANADAVRDYDDARDKFSKQDVQGEIESLKHAVEADPKFTRAWLWLGEIYQSMLQLDAATGAYRKAIEIDPKAAVAYKALALNLLRPGKFEESVPVWKELIKIAPDDAAGPLGLAGSLYALKRYTEALPAYEAGTKLLADNPDMWINLGSAAIHAGNEEECMAAFKKALTLAPNSMNYNKIAYELAEVGKQLDNALNWASKAVSEEEADSRRVQLSQLTTEDLQITPRIAAFWDTLGWVYFRRGDLKQAEEYLNAAWILSQNWHMGDHLGQVFEGQKKTAAAIRMYRYTLNRVPANYPALKEPVSARLDKLSPGASASDFQANMDATGELSQLRTAAIHFKTDEDAHAEFFIAFARNPKTKAVEIADVKFISGSEKLKSAGDAIQAAAFKVPLPADANPRLIRRGILVCPARSGCSMALLNPEDVHSVN